MSLKFTPLFKTALLYLCLTSFFTVLAYEKTIAQTPATALDFAGNQYARIPSVTLNSAFTVEAWVLYRQGNGRICTANSHQLIIDDYDNTRTVRLYFNGSAILSTPGIIQYNQWMHVTCVVNGANSKIYVNGVDVTGSGSIGAGTITNSVFDLGMTGDWGWGLNGKLDEFRIWNRALCQSEIQNNMNCELNPVGQTGLYALFHLNQGNVNSNNASVNTALDESGNNRNANLIGFALNGTNSNWTTGTVTGNCSPFTPAIAAITGNTGICVGGTTTLSNATAGGKWSSSNTNVATVNTTSGVVTGVAAGTAIITYTTDCNAVTTTVTVNAAATATNNGPVTLGNTINLSVTAINGANYAWTGPNGFTSSLRTPSITNATAANGGTYNVTVTNAGGCTANVATNVTVLVDATGLNFDASNDYAKLSNTAAAGVSSTGGTWEAWVKRSNWSMSSYNLNVLFGNEYDFPSSNSFYISLHEVVGLHFRYGGQSQTGNMYTASSVVNSFAPNSWHHLAATWKTTNGATTISIYVDGVLADSKVANMVIPSFANLYLGGMPGRTSAGATMDEVRVWNRALCQSEIQNNMNCALPNPAMQNALAAYYPLNQGSVGANNTSVNSIADASSNNQSATLFNFALNGNSSNWVTGNTITGNCNVFNTTVAAITGNMNICTGATTQLSNTTTGGVWSSSNNAIATVSTSGLVSGVTAGTVTISYTTVCGGAATATVTVHPLPTITASGPITFCAGGNVVLTASAGTSYLWSNNATTQSITVTGSGNYSVTVTNTGGCSATTAPVAVVVNAIPATATVAAPASVCAGATVTLTASSSESTPTYKWYDALTGGNLLYTGAVFTSPVLNATTTYYTEVQNATGCTTASRTATTVKVIAVNDQSVTSSVSAICGNGNATVTLASSQTGVQYTLRNNATNAIIAGPVEGTGSAINFNTGTISATTTYNVLAQNSYGALNFDGLNNYVELNTTTAALGLAGNSFTVSAWVYRNNNQGGDQEIFGNVNGCNLHLLVRGNRPYLGFCGNDLGGNTVINSNQWYHIAFVYNAATQTQSIYVNGVLDASVSGRSPLSNDGTALRIGGYGTVNNASGKFAGKIDDLQIWNFAQSQAQISAGMNNCVTGTESGLKAYYNFDEGTGLALTDRTGHGFNGVLTNMSGSEWTSGKVACGAVCSVEMSNKPTITVDALPVVTISGTTTACGSVTLTAAGGTSYVWSGGDAPTSATNTFATSGTYSVTATGSGNCTASASAVVSALTPISGTVSSTNPTCTTNGTISVSNPQGPGGNILLNTNFSALPVGASLFGNAAVTGGECILTPAQSGTQGYILFPATSTPNAFTASFDLRIADGNGADGMSFNYGVVAPGGNYENGIISSGLAIGFIEFAGSRVVINYNGAQLTSAGFSLINTSYRTCNISINGNGQLTLSIGGTPVFTNYQLPAAYNTANKSAWRYAFAARCGGLNNKHSIDNVNIADNSPLQYSINGTNWQTSTTFSVPAGNYTVQARWSDGSVCGPQTIGTATLVMPANPEAPAVTNATRCGNGSVILTATPANGETIDWYASSVGGPVLASGTNTYTTPTLGTNTIYYAQARNTNTGCVSARVAVTATVNSLPVAAIVPAGATSFCPGGSVVLNANTGSGLSYQWNRNGQPVVEATHDNFTATQSGSYTVAVTNSNNCSTTSSAVVINATDITVPVVVTKNITLSLDANGNAVLTAAEVNNGSTDNCAIASMVVDKTSFTCANLGQNTVVLTVTDVNGNTASNTAIITVTDNIAPVFTVCSSPINRVATSAAGAVVTYTLPVATDNCTATVTRTAGLASGAIFPIGTTTVTHTATDASGNTVNCSFDVTVSGLAPQINCVSDIVTIAANGQCGIFVNFTATETTGIPVSTITYSVSPNSFFAVGETIVTVTATNAVGTSSCSFKVTVTDNQQPVFATISNINAGNDNDSCGAMVTVTAPNVTDNCGVASVTGVRSDNAALNAMYPVGVTTITWTATDIHGNSSTSSQTITVNDTQNPTAIAQNLTINLNAAGTAGITAAQINNGSSDNCGIATISVSKTSFDCSNVGANTVILTVTDVNGNSSTATALVTVVDNINPTITAPANITQGTDAGVCGATVNLGTPLTADNCSIATVTNNAPTLFPVGTTVVTWTVTDANGNSSTATQTVVVSDTEKPMITAPAMVSVVNTPGTCATAVNLGTPVTSDNCGVASVTNNAPALFPVGTTVVTWTVTDIHGNVTDTATQTVVVIDNENPTISVSNISVNNDAGKCGATVSISLPQTGDNCGVATVMGERSDNKLLTEDYPVGTTTITWTVTDIHGNSKVATQTVVVSDTEKPMITAPAMVSVVNTPGTCATAVNLGTPVTGDNCGVASVTNNAPALFPVGTTIVRWTVTDVHGNVTDTATQTVVVIDNENPTISVSNISVNNDAGKCGATINISLPQTGDNCGVATVMGVRSDNKLLTEDYPVGTTTISWTVRDVNGNIKTATQTVVVTDNEKPVIVCAANQVFCANTGGNTQYTIAALNQSDNCGIATTSYTVTGATNRTGTGTNASGSFAIGTSTVTFTVRDIHGNTSTCSFTVTVNPLPVASISAASPDALCSQFTLTANSTLSGPYSYQWLYNNTTKATTQQLSLGLTDADGVYSVYTTDVNGCRSEQPATYTYQKQNLVSSYTILGLKEVKLGQYDKVETGSVGVMSSRGEAEFDKYSSVTGAGSFVKAPRIDTDKGVTINSKIYGIASVSLPTMQYNLSNTRYLQDKTVNSNVTATIAGNYDQVTLKKGSNVTLTGTVFGKIKLEEGASVRFTSTTIDVEEIQIEKGPKTGGYSYIRFAPNTSIRVSKKVTIGSDVIVNPEAYQVTFFMADNRRDEEKFHVKGDDTRITANIILPDGKLKVTGGNYGDDRCDHRPHSSNSCRHRGHGHHDCDHRGHGDRDCRDDVFMTGLFIAEEVESEGKNVIWNSYNCAAPSAPVTTLTSNNNTASVMEEATSVKVQATSKSEEELKVTVMPNPSTTYFTLKFESRNDAPLTLRVVDASGRVVDARTKVGANSTIQIGHNYNSGNYFAEIVQGTKRKVVQLIKVRG
jgi:hypothetical protein